MIDDSGASANPDDSDAWALILRGRAPAFVRVLDRIRAFANTEETVLVEGETGTGKELVARAIHDLGLRHCRSFIAVNCGAIPDSLIEDELFGHTRGAFTDARHERSGLMSAADRGTLCLDEVGSLSARAQAALLRVLQDRTFRTLGSNVEKRIDTRFVALTNVPLWDLVQRGAFRADLYFRLCVLPLRLPPLRDRVDDIVPLARHFLAKHERPNHVLIAISPQAQTVLEHYDWPGNVRQLEHAIIRATHVCETSRIDIEDLDLPGSVLGAETASNDVDKTGPSFIALKREAIASFERRYLMNLMQHCHGNVTRAARVAQKERRDLGKLLKKYNIQPKTFVGA